MNRKLRFLLLSNTLFVFAGNLFVPLYALFILKVGGGAELAGELIGLQFFVSFIVGFFVTRLKDKPKLCQYLLMVNYLLRGIAWLLIGLFPSISTLVIAQIIVGISEAIGSPAFNSLFSENLDYKKHIKEWGSWELIKNPVIALSSVMGGFVAAQFGFSSLFLLMSILAFMSLIVYLFT